MAHNRRCGGCTACCKTHAILELNKPAGEWCGHCNIGHGCRIYSERPESCRSFKCAWLMGIGLAQYRPDKTGIVTEFINIHGLGSSVWFFEASEGAIESKFVKRQTAVNLAIGSPVMHVPIEGNPKLYMPPGRLSTGLAFSVSTRRVEIIPFVRRMF